MSSSTNEAKTAEQASPPQERTHERKLPDEDPNDPFDRQRVILGWKQELLEQQVCFVLGVGGLGCSVAMCLARLGVRKLYLLDRDTVDMSNLNRQILFRREDVGRPKVEAAADTLRREHLIGGPNHTEVEVLHMDVLENWGRVVDIAKECTVLFNNIDIGSQFDYAVLQLAKQLRIPYAAGSSYATTSIVEYYSGKPEDTTLSMQADSKWADVAARVDSEVLTAQQLNFITADANPPTRTIGSNFLVCGTAGLMTTGHWCQALMGHDMKGFTKLDVVSYDVLAF